MLPLDAGMAALRAPSDPLRQWLRESGFRSAAFLPVASDGLRLAMIAGLGRQPRFPGLGLRAALELFAEALALRLRLVLPAHHEAWAPDAQTEPLSVLIVEDQHMVATQLAAALGEAGAKVVRICGTVDAALEALDESFDAALLDYTLGGENVIPVARALEALGKPFVFASGHGDDLDLPLAFAGKPIVGKPYRSKRSSPPCARPRRRRGFIRNLRTTVPQDPASSDQAALTLRSLAAGVSDDGG